MMNVVLFVSSGLEHSTLAVLMLMIFLGSCINLGFKQDATSTDLTDLLTSNCLLLLISF